MKVVDYNHLDVLMSCLDESKQVLWVRSKDYTQQVYVSTSFESIWEVPCVSLYENPEIFLSTVNRDEYSDYILGANERRRNFTQDNLDDSLLKPLWRIKTPSGQLKYIYDSPMLLVDEKGNHVGFCGIGGELTQEAWLELYYQGQSNSLLETDNKVDKIRSLLKQQINFSAVPIQKDTKFTPVISVNDQKIQLSNREWQVLKYLLLGFCAKKIAMELSISHRTVEYHINNIKEKASCRRIVELLGKIKIDQARQFLLSTDT